MGVTYPNTHKASMESPSSILQLEVTRMKTFHILPLLNPWRTSSAISSPGKQ